MFRLCASSFALFLALLPVPVVAQASARAAACELDSIREIIVGSDRAGLEDSILVENTVDWVPDYNRFAAGDAAASLRTATEAVSGRPSRAQCRALLPFAAVALSAARLSAAGAPIAAGAVLVPCEDGQGLCLPPATQVIADQCRVRLLDLPWQASC
jgi:hypothetical protein